MTLARSERPARRHLDEYLQNLQEGDYTLPTVDRLHPAVAEVLIWFEYDHLPHDSSARTISKRFCLHADDLALMGQCTGPELTVALRKMLEAKDAAVRSALRGDV